VQALYEMELAQASADAAIEHVLAPGCQRGLGEEGEALPPDPEHVRTLVVGVAVHQARLDADIAAALSGTLALERLEALLRAILRCGAYEVRHLRAIPHRVVIDEYLHVAHAFFAGREPTIVNAVLDRLARRHRGPVGAVGGTDEPVPAEGEAAAEGDEGDGAGADGTGAAEPGRE
jgi:N utilization substance protein B